MTNTRIFRLGHNQGPPLDPMQSWRRHCWKAAKKALFRPLPVEVVRRRVARAARLGLAYRRYELLVLGGGEIEAILFAGDTLIVTAPYASPADGLDPGAVRKLATVTGCRRLLLAGPDGLDLVWTRERDPAALFDAAIRVPSRQLLAAPPVKADRAALGAGLRDCAIAAGSVALVGNGAHGPSWVAWARLAGFVPASEYFSA
ncbi:MAG: hypothetical protein E4H18_03495 [Hyphomicrobiales bacterium]|nr:MAG: hypothetical protein E4H18_03495 [Hyphomicrobiales bacterium]